MHHRRLAPASCKDPDHAQALQNHLQAESDLRDAEHDGKHLKHGPDSSEDRLGKQHRHPIESMVNTMPATVNAAPSLSPAKVAKTITAAIP